MHDEFVVTAVGPDRPGIAAGFTAELYAAGANLADTRMINLRGQFALLALVEGSADVLESVKVRLRENASKLGLTFHFSTAPKASAREGVPFRLYAYSMDEPGIVNRISTFLHERDINIEELETRVVSSPYDGYPLFRMEMVILIPTSVNVNALRRALENLGNQMSCDVVLDQA